MNKLLFIIIYFYSCFVVTAQEKDFYNQLISDFPDFTESNLRIILLSKLGLSNQDVSSLLGVTIDAVKKAKQRLKKKIGSDYNSILEEL